MRIFIDCTHTAKHNYKNTGIHRVVRELTTELANISQNYQNIEVIDVMFDGKFITRVTNLHHQNYIHHHKNSLFDWMKNKKFQIFLNKVNNKILNYFSGILFWAYWFDLNSDNKFSLLEFEGHKILPGDIYVIADANWDLPKTYYKFLQILKKHDVIVAVICYDIIPMKFPEFCSQKLTKDFNNFYENYSNLFDQVLCISKNSADDYKNARSKGIVSNNNPNLIVKSFRLGCDYSSKISRSNLNDKNCNDNIKRLLTKKYILVVGSLVPHKNLKSVIEAFDLLVDSTHEQIYLLFAGNKGWDSKTDHLIESHRMHNNIIHILGSVTDFELNLLYQNCYCLVQASFYEGFGLPVVEALQHGKPVISSNGGSLPEIGGDFCIYFNPKEPIELYQALEKLVNSKTFYNELVTRIRNEYIPFSWEESAKQLLSLLSIQKN
ncbi:glycosyltransferase family 4 protein [Anabaena cylindrica FACHB-243]|uniref:Glycosyl transferase group 1 n=1 Tax=Anabaena cylindrica (strain ATCC 27899 / PCC 7122) TaxID=272123 RepID=K9ZPK3_ANACC|nr:MULTISPECIES: glycosyltransferase family 1 protein [Anabaena]AFZ60255.1 glycosyl transferase group 1 [Anabaena cylindrica PCC 7122]MBD2417692.1 glycosyltransferase family 4 protein [Anabaena cylindrica FACHB-243]MBY5281269.1 glycosyltransferase family 4 protein [Anabaena sp. CCAP 1446/1C]MBY5306647.1 glycosyltransferase family 4 protein [Anabaena sp. CCAP 1446/1C]MCM2404607.1 glycosyltransferase family 4 protein [Anabaena sp. CCAP 1446/1C]